MPGEHGSQNPRAPAAAGDAAQKQALKKFRTKSRRTEAESYGLSKPMAARKIVLNLPERWHRPWSSPAAEIVGWEGWSHSPFPVNWITPRLRRAHMEAGSHHLSLSLSKINVGLFK